jgi:lipopolysaccharide transport system permease protein
MTIAQYFRLIDVQAKMLLKADASKLVLGYLWWFLEPLLWVAVFYLVFNTILESKGRSGSEFLLFLACGKFAFIWFSKTVTKASNSIVANKSLVSKIDVPKSMFPMAVVQESLYRQASVYLCLFFMLGAFGTPITMAWLWLLPVLFVNYLLIVACSFVGAYLVCLVRDISQLIPLGMMFLLFTSGIFWDIRSIDNPEKAELILALNPLAFLLDAHRQVLLHQTMPDLVHLFYIAVGAVLLSLVMLGLMRKNSQSLALKVLTS